MATKTVKTPAVKKTAIKKVATKKTTASVTPSTLDPRIFAYQVKPALLTQVLHVYRSTSHQDTSKVKTRGELTKTTKKVYKQKGTGNARHGSRMAPTYVGGGIAHGPTGVQPKNLKVNRKMKAAALAGILSLYAANDQVELVTLPSVQAPKVKSVKVVLPKANTLFVYHSEARPVLASLNNLANVTAVPANQLTAYQVASAKHLAVTTAAADSLVARLLPLLKSTAKQ